MSYQFAFWGGVASGMVAGASIMVGLVYIATTPPQDYVWAGKHDGKINEREKRHGIT
jgi:hypothetical protein